MALKFSWKYFSILCITKKSSSSSSSSFRIRPPGLFPFRIKLQLWILQTARGTSRTGDKPCHKAATYKGQHKQKKRGQTSMPRIGNEPTIPVFERALDRATTVIGYNEMLVQWEAFPVTRKMREDRARSTFDCSTYGEISRSWTRAGSKANNIRHDEVSLYGSWNGKKYNTSVTVCR
jgi:hypothetical protein